jgi:hypothetical protein
MIPVRDLQAQRLLLDPDPAAAILQAQRLL